MHHDKEDMMSGENWQNDIETAIEEGLFQNRYKILVLVTSDTAGLNTEIASKCAHIFYRYGLIEKDECEYYWLLNILSGNAESALVRQLADQLQSGRKLQVITDLHQYIYDMGRSAALVKKIACGLSRLRTDLPVVFLAKAGTIQWLNRMIGTENVLYIDDGTCLDDPEKPETDSFEWYEQSPDLVRFESERIKKTCADYTDGKIYCLQGSNCIYRIFKYTLGNHQCKILILYHRDFPNADGDNVTIIPMAPAYDEFRRLHGEAIDYVFSKDLGRAVVSLKVKPQDVPEGRGYAETVWKKYFSALQYINNSTGRKKDMDCMPWMGWTITNL